MLFCNHNSGVLAISQPAHAWISGQLLRAWAEPPELNYDHQRADLFKGNQRTAQVINLDHGAPLSAFAQRQRCQTFVAVPIVSRPEADLPGSGTSVDH